MTPGLGQVEVEEEGEKDSDSRGGCGEAVYGLASAHQIL